MVSLSGSGFSADIFAEDYTPPVCPQNDDAPIPDGTHTEIINYVIDGIRCIINIVEHRIQKEILDELLDKMTKVYKDASEGTCHHNTITAQIDTLFHKMMPMLGATSGASLAKQQRLIDAAWKKIATEKSPDSSEIDIVNGMLRSHRVARRCLQGSYTSVLKHSPLIIEVAKDTAYEVTALLAATKTGGSRNTGKIKKLVAATGVKIRKIAYESLIDITVLENNIIKSLEHTLQMIPENLLPKDEY